MKKVCAWCNREMEAGEGGDQSVNGFVSHGICHECADNVEFQLGVSIRKFLNSFPVPVILTDLDGRAVTANSKALNLVNKELVAIKHALLGNVFECAYSRLPGGCGKTIHCSGCTIRRAVQDTFISGRPSVNLPATIACNRKGVGEVISLLISTEKALNYVILKVESATNNRVWC